MADDYHENSFIFKTITFVRIVAGVAVTLAVLFAMVWLIDYSSPRTVKPQTPQPLLVPDLAEEHEARTPRTFFETLLNTATEKNVDGVERADTTPERAIPAGRPKGSASVSRMQPDASARGSDPTHGAARLEQPATRAGTSSPPVAPEPEQDRAASAPASQASAAGGVFAVQFGSFQHEERARQLSEDLAGRGYHPYITTISLPDGTKSHRVRVGRFATREEAMKLAAAIENKEKISVFVTSK